MAWAVCRTNFSITISGGYLQTVSGQTLSRAEKYDGCLHFMGTSRDKKLNVASGRECIRIFGRRQQEYLNIKFMARNDA
jgi:hypothetical protein